MPSLRLFSIRGDLTRLDCAAVLLPCDGRLSIDRVWQEFIKIARDATAHTGWRVIEEVDAVAPGIWRARSGGAPVVWLCDTSGTPQSIADNVRAALEQVEASDLPSGRVIGLPVFGTGASDSAGTRRDVIRRLLPALEAGAGRLDVVLVVNQVDNWDAVTIERQRRQRRSLDERLSAAVERCVRDVMEGRAAVFAGAGVSMSVGLPSWAALIEELGKCAGLNTAGRRALLQRTPINAAEALDVLLGREEIQDFIVKRFTRDKYGLMHGLLASLDVQAYATTNYDGLLEQALHAAGRRPARIREGEGQRLQPQQPWVVALHGDVQHPSEIVLSRSDYERFQASRGTFGALLQTLFVTRSLLYFGFGLQDDNIARLAAEVVEQLPMVGQSLGTAFAIEPTAQLAVAPSMSGRLNLVSTADVETEGVDAARYLQEVVDEIVIRSSGSLRYLLHADFQDLEQDDPAERHLVASLRAADAAKDSMPQGHPLRLRLARIFNEFGD